MCITRRARRRPNKTDTMTLEGFTIMTTIQIRQMLLQHYKRSNRWIPLESSTQFKFKVKTPTSRQLAILITRRHQLQTRDTWLCKITRRHKDRLSTSIQIRFTPRSTYLCRRWKQWGLRVNSDKCMTTSMGRASHTKSKTQCLYLRVKTSTLKRIACQVITTPEDVM